ncbi:Bis-ABC ATPase YheS [hydrothermal vent metagenome]|uniref:Bis-ABC ATPase YheS n=1 Tax=hydrothermal vent metagenome TaxID=652676 RepID=A0A3B1C0R8_9ZZZZ
MLKFSDISLRRGTKLLFEDASLTIHPGQKVGVTGANGTGKSSLFGLILGELHTDAGDFSLPSKWIIAHVAQETLAADLAAIEYVMDGDAELRAVQRKLAVAEQEADGHQVAEQHAQLESMAGYSARSRAARLMQGLGFQTDQEEMPVQSFSGGWRMRLNLAQALMCRSDLLLLDEPTNHLDLDAVIWLEEWLRGYPGTLLIISHDRDFLDAVVTNIAHIEQQAVQLYTGNYSGFEVIRAQRLANQQASYEKQQRVTAHLHSYIDRFRAKATKARQAQSRIKALERMEQIAPAHVDSPFSFEFSAPEKTPDPLLRLDAVDVGYGQTRVLGKVDFSLCPGDRLGLLGPNGAGKSTLIKLFSGDLAPLAGSCIPAAELRIGYFAQHQVEQLCLDASPLDHLQRLAPKASEQSLRSFIGGFGFVGDQALGPVAPLSGGEKARLVLALLVFQRPNLLLLDEPTNHLDLEMRHALSVALQGYEGALVIVSHDRHLLRTTTDRLLLVAAGEVSEFPGSLDDYPRWLTASRAAAEPKVDATAGENSAVARKARKQREAEHRRRLQPLRKQLQRLEQEMECLTKNQVDLGQQLAAPDIYDDTQKENLKKLLGKKAGVDCELARTEEAWFTAGAELEAAEQE